MRIWIWTLVAAWGASPVAEGLLAQYRAAGAEAPDPARGKTLWTATFPAPDGGAARACTSCHGPDLASTGRHATTGEPIEPMTAPGRLTDAAKIEKWFGRNCRWTLGRDCTATERADLLVYLTRGGE